MQNSERQKFEESWKSAFDGAEMSPSDGVWNAIEVDLAGAESGMMKKRVVFYQRLAAATVTFALLSGLYAFYVGSDQQNQLATKQKEQSPVSQNNSAKAESTPATTPNEANTQPPQESTASNTPDNNAANSSTTGSTRPDINSSDNVLNQSLAKSNKTNSVSPGQPTTAKSQKNGTGTNPGTDTIQPSVTDNLVAVVIPEVNNESNVSTISKDNESPAVSTVVTTDNKNDQKSEEPVKQVTSPILQTAPLVATLEPNDKPERTDKTKSRENLWLALGGTAGSYAPNNASSSAEASGAGTFGMASSFFDNATMQKAQSSSAKVGTSYSVGLAFGKKIGRRFVLQSGVNLNKQQIDYTSNFDATLASSNTTKAALADYQFAAGNAMVNRTNSYTVNSAMEVVSIPLQAGYLIVDRKFSWLMNAGVSSDFFIKNTLVDKSGQRESFTQSAGEDSPYRSVNWSGLLNTELSYKIGEHYRFSVVPGVRYTFNPLLKESGDNGRPVFLDLGFRFKYLFD
jgi:hypothetical protein